jgi:hypothetical protein
MGGHGRVDGAERPRPALMVQRGELTDELSRSEHGEHDVMRAVRPSGHLQMPLFDEIHVAAVVTLGKEGRPCWPPPLPASTAQIGDLVVVEVGRRPSRQRPTTVHDHPIASLSPVLSRA